MRTRRAVLLAAIELIKEGRTPTVAEAADAAEVSRATAYRYFPSQDALLTEAALVLPPELVSPKELLSGPDAPAEVEDRVVRVHEVMFDHIRAKEPQFRLYLRAQLLTSLQETSAGTNRPGFRIALLDAALEPLSDELPEPELERLRNALGVLIGTEALIAMRDVLHVEHDTAREQLEWACRTLIRAARAHSPQPPGT